MLVRKTYLGKVQRSLHPACSYVRVSVSREGERVLLSVKATFSNFRFSDFKRGDWVEMVRDPNDATRYSVVRLLKERSPTVKEEKVVPVKEEKIRFFLGCRYYDHPRLPYVLNKAFGTNAKSIHGTEGGLWIVCRPDQFAKFMIYRNEAGITNGFMDLQAKVVSEPIDQYTSIAELLHVDRDIVKKVALALMYSGEPRTEVRPFDYDVTKN